MLKILLQTLKIRFARKDRGTTRVSISFKISSRDFNVPSVIQDKDS